MVQKILATHQVQPTCQRPRYSSAGSMPGKQFLKSGQGRFSREPPLPPCQAMLIMNSNVFLFQMRTHLPKMMNCSIISAREELQIILRKSDLNSQFKTPIYPKKYLIFKCPKLQVTNLPNGNLDPGASDFKPRVGTFVNHPPENKKNHLKIKNHL